jgi:hypothetical protein
MQLETIKHKAAALSDVLRRGTLRTDLPELIKSLLPGKHPKRIKRSPKTYLEQQGWTRSGTGGDARWEGYYRCRHGSFPGRVHLHTPPRFLIHLTDKPLAAMRRHSHWSCFSPQGNGWYYAHFSQVPADLSSGLLAIERILDEAHSLPKTA